MESTFRKGKEMKFEITFRDEIEVENEEEVFAALIQYLHDCVQFKDVSVFNIYKLEPEENEE